MLFEIPIQSILLFSSISQSKKKELVNTVRYELAISPRSSEIVENAFMFFFDGFSFTIIPHG